MKAKVISTKKAPAAVGPYSQAIGANGLVFVSGQLGIDPATGKLVEGDIEVQAERVLQNIRAVLAEAGTSLAKVVKATVFLVDLADFPRMNAVYARHFTSDPKPARSTIQVAKLPAGSSIEIEVVAAL